MIHSKIPLAQTIVQLCKAKNIKHIILSPGSRNAPLTIGFTNDSFFKCYSLVDERSAAFFAMGIAQQIKQPTAVVCTSGSALLNYYPAIAEAFYSNIPLVILSADRPKYLIGIGDGQTINQENVYKNHILYSASLKLDVKEKIKQNVVQNFNEKEINIAINTSIEKKGPIHINIPFDEPLYDKVDVLKTFPQVIKTTISASKIDNSTIEPCINEWNKSNRKMILIGVNTPNEIDEKWIDILAKDASVIVLTETISNIHHPSFFNNIDQLISKLSLEKEKAFTPDILVTFGGLIVSKKIKQLLRKYKPKNHWHIGEEKANDTFFCLNKHLKINPNCFFKKLLPNVTLSNSSLYRDTWEALKHHRLKKHSEYLETIPFSDFMVFSEILKTIPNNSILQVSNSSAIRYTQLFSLNKTIHVFCNRGTSGIDGSTSTAVGCAVANKTPTIFITGDLSFLYDSNALWNNHIPENFRIILVNNQGGGIFRILPGEKNTENFDTYFETTHKHTAAHLCNMHGFEYESATNKKTLKSVLKTFYSKGNKPKLLEIFTPKNTNDNVLLNYFEFIK